MSNKTDFSALTSIKSKIKAEDDKKIRGLSFAKLYFANKDYEKALKYVNEYLTIKSNSAEAHRVLGDVHEALDNNEKAFESYKKSYFLDKSQENLLFKICEKLENLNVDNQTVKAWLDRLEKKYPHHQSVFNLKDKLQLENGNCSSRLEDTFRDLSNVKLADLTDDRCANLSCSFLSNTSAGVPNAGSLTPGHFKSLERSQDRLFKKVIEIEENFVKQTNQILEIVKESQSMFGQLKNEVDQLSSGINKLQLGQSEVKEMIDTYMNAEYEHDDEEDEDEETETEDACDENNLQNISTSFLSCNSTSNPQNTSDVFSRLGPAKQQSPPKQTTPQTTKNSFIQQPTPPQKSQTLFSNQPLVVNQSKQAPPIGIMPVFGNFESLPQPSFPQSVQPPVIAKSPLDQMSVAISKIGLPNTTTPTVNARNTSTNQTTTQISTPSVTNDARPLSELFKDQFKGKWVCNTCYCSNDLSANKCVSCETPNPAAPQAPSTNKPFSFNPTPNAGGFSFAQALQQISPPKTQQTVANETTTKSQNKFSFGSNQSSGFTFDNSSLFSANQNSTNQSSKPSTTFPLTEQTPSVASESASIFSTIKPDSGFSFNSPNLSALNTSNITPVFGRNFLANANKLTSPNEQVTSSAPVANNNANEEKSIGDGEDDPQVDFKPVIPLPPKVDTVTGEEDEKVLFVHRAKLYRYNVKEWKERGLGDIKILFHEQEARYRLLMRREQIHKVCLNTPILSTFTFQKNTNAAGNTLQFGCCDFSEGLGKAEVFILRFKLKETADRFKSEVERIVNLLNGANPTSPSTNIAESTPKTNVEKDEDIEIVFVKQPKSKEHEEQAKKLRLPINFFSHLDEVKPCSGCFGCKDHIPKLRYEIASADDKENVKTEEAQKDVNQSENLFSTAIADAGSVKSLWAKSDEEPSWMKSALKPIFSSSNTATTGNEENPEADIETLDFKPVIPLPDLIEVKTGEEEEEVLFSSRAKLFKFTNNEWKERGLGDFKILRQKDNPQKIRFLMRREQIHKICLNHSVDKSLKIGKRVNRENIYQWCATDFSEDAAGKPSNFNIKFKNKEIGAQMIEALKANVDGFEVTIFT